MLEEGAPCPVMGFLGCRPLKICENIGAYLCSLVHFWRPVQPKMYNSVFTFDFGRSISWHQVIKSGPENPRFSVPLLKVARNLPSLPYRFRGP